MLLRSLTALVLGGMTDLVAITAAATALGVLEIGVGANASSPTLIDPILAAVVFVALLVIRRRSTSRVALDDVSTWRASEDVRPVPAALARLPLVRLARWSAGVVVVTFAVALPQVLSVDRSLKASALLIYAILGLSLVVLTGWAGQVSLGQIGFFAIGAALGAKATQDWNFDLALALVLVAAVGAAVAVVVGLPALRRRGLELAVITLAFALAATAYFLNHSFFAWVPNKRIDRPPLFGRIDISSATAMYYLSLAVLAACLVGLQGVRRSRTGRALIALRDNERGAQAYALDATRLRLVAFAMSGALAAVAGCLLSMHEQAYDPQLFGPFQNLSIFTMVIVGGVAAPPAPCSARSTCSAPAGSCRPTGSSSPAASECSSSCSCCPRVSAVSCIGCATVSSSASPVRAPNDEAADPTHRRGSRSRAARAVHDQRSGRGGA